MQLLTDQWRKVVFNNLDSKTLLNIDNNSITVISEKWPFYGTNNRTD